MSVVITILTEFGYHKIDKSNKVYFCIKFARITERKRRVNLRLGISKETLKLREDRIYKVETM